MITCTMSDIKNHVTDLRYKSVEQYHEKLSTDFEKYIEEHSEIQVEISEYEAACKKATSLHNKYVTENWRRRDYSYNLKSIIRTAYFESKNDEIQKIKDQFYAIEQKLKAIRSPQKAIEFLKLCGIELPDNGQIQQDIPVDPEFIKSILPAPKRLTGEAKS